jgi:hypothetical protein
MLSVRLLVLVAALGGVIKYDMQRARRRRGRQLVPA